jgi:glycosyltransferase involved in cell wall biosynthesis
LSFPVRVHVLDPSAFTPPYDHALCRALAAAGAEVELYTSRFAYGELPPAAGYRRHETFYGAAARLGSPRARRLAKAAGHVAGMLRYARTARAADVVHFQWLTIPQLDRHLLPRGRPLVITAHDILPRQPTPGQRGAQRRLYGRFDAVVVHSEHGRRRLTGELGIDPQRVHVIPHGVLRPWEGSPAEDGALAADVKALLEGAGAGPVVLFFGLLRPYKGLELLLEAWRELHGAAGPAAQLWIVGMPRMDLGALRAGAPADVRFLSRFISDREILALMRTAGLLVLPYRDIDQSGVAFTALGAGLPMLLSDAGGFPEIAAAGAARTFAAGDAIALADALRQTLADPAALRDMRERARAAAAGRYSWEAIAGRTLALYESLIEEYPRP